MAQPVKKTAKNKGNPNLGPGPGRPKGLPNKVTKTIKDAIEAAFEEVGAKNYLVTMAKEDRKAFAALLAKIIPTKVEGGLTLEHLFSPAQLREMADLQEGK